LSGRWSSTNIQRSKQGGQASSASTSTRGQVGGRDGPRAGGLDVGRTARAMEDVNSREAEIDRLRGNKWGRKVKVREIEAVLEALKAETNGYASRFEEVTKHKRLEACIV